MVAIGMIMGQSFLNKVTVTRHENQESDKQLTNNPTKILKYITKF